MLDHAAEPSVVRKAGRELLRRAPFLRPYVTALRAQRFNRARSSPLDKTALLRSLFDADFYRRSLAERNLPVPEGDLFEHWLGQGRTARIVPTPLFDEGFYQRTYPEIAAAGLWGFDHFATAGLFEKRWPHPWFDPGWYGTGSRDTLGDLPPYLDYLAIGAERDISASPRLQHLQRADGSHASISREDLGELVQATAAFGEILTQPIIDRVVTLFVPGFYRRTAGLAFDTSCVRALAHFIRDGLWAGFSPSPLFEGGYYVEKAIAAGLEAPSEAEPPILHWLRHGVPARIVPTPLFDEPFYLKTYPDVAAAGIWGFYHFIEDGVFQGRRPSPAPMVRIANAFDLELGLSAPSLYDALAGALPGETQEGNALRAHTTLSVIAKRHRAVLGSSLFAEAFARAVAIEPRIGEVERFSEIFLPPYSERLHTYLVEIRRRLRRDRYDHVICIPWVRMGGADLVSGHLAQGLHRLRPDDSILVLRTETSHLDRPEWFPDAAEMADVSDILRPLGPEERSRLLYHLFVGIEPKHILNVNSHQCWETFQRFGRQLSAEIDLICCLFAWGYAPSGRKVGYASEYFSETAPFLKAVVTDNTWIKGELVRQYALPAEIADKIVTCWMPTRARAGSVSAAELAPSAMEGRRPLVLWAGRLDREKRFDLLLAVADAMPDVDFLCWGASVLDAPIDLSSVPANVTVQPPFSSPDALPLGSATAWLYTSASDGMPNLVVELASAGVPLVASAVGGVPELVRPDTGWPISDVDNPEAYVSALRDIIADPSERLARATRLQQLALSRHNTAAFDRTLSSLLQADHGNDHGNR